jgi:pimeloyl-ACP methyl ester carboxylesterase
MSTTWLELPFDGPETNLNVMVGPPAGPRLLFLHGVTRRWQDFLTLMPALAGRWQIRGLDFRGHGRSGRVPGSYRLSDYVRDAISLVRARAAEPAVLYGHSLGALVAVGVAAEQPEHVRAVVLEDPPAPALVRDIRKTPFFALFTGMRELAGCQQPVHEVARRLAELRLPGPSGQSIRLGELRDATALRFGARCLRDLDPDVLTPLLDGQWLAGYDWERALSGVRCPALLLRADEACGGMLSVSAAGAMTERLADCARIDLPGCGHLIHWEQPEKTLRYVVGFLESLR